MSKNLEHYIKENQDRFVQELIQLLSFPSISSLNQHKEDLKKTAEWLKTHLLAIGLKNCAVYPTKGHPVVYGEWTEAKGKPTILIYGHYDVQPVDPLNLWHHPPFQPVIKNDHIYARGAADDKGQFFAHLKSIEAQLKVNGKLPLNVKILLEGEEEIGSVNLELFLRENVEMLKNDVIIVSDSPMVGLEMPTICYGLRGLTYMEIKVTGPGKDLHSGSFGGVVANPIEVLCQIVAGLKDRQGRVKIPGFYAKVRPISPSEKANFRKIPLDEKEYLADIGSPAFFGEKGYSLQERIWVRPTLDPNGIVGGFTGEGAKTIRPSYACCKISMRIVPDQDPHEIGILFEKFVRQICPPTVKLEVIKHHGGKPYLLPIDDPIIQKVAKALKRGFGKDPYFVREGGSIPIVTTFKEILGSNSILLPMGLPDENTHSPNENFYLPNFFAGIKTAAYLFEELAIT